MTKRILIVEDEPSVAQMLKDYFTYFNHGHQYEIKTETDGANAVIALVREHFDLVLLDLNIPKMGGLEVLTQMNGLDLRIPTVVVTGNPDPVAAGEVMRRGAFSYLPKPVDLQSLDHVVALALSTSTGRTRPKR